MERDLFINDSVAIDGLGEDDLTLDGGFIFNVESDVNLAIASLNLVGGKIVSDGNLTLTNSTITQTIARSGSSDNSSIISRGNLYISNSSIVDSDGGGNLGILIESGTAEIESSTIANHEGVLNGSGVLILTDERVDLINSTIANNQNRFVGGVANSGGAEVNITNTTIANNNGGLGSGGIQNNSGIVTVTSSILANNTGGGFRGDIFGDGEFISGGNNLISNGDDATGFVDGVNGDLVGSNGDDPLNPQNELLIDARLGELQDNGGSTETIALLNGSPAIDAGSNPNNLETDQRGEGFDRTIGNGTDIGAYEVQDLIDNPEIVNNVFIGTDGNDTISGTPEDELIFGLKGDDSLGGNDGNDTISGGKGDDRLEGNNGNDILIGEKGNDTLIGGHGRDNLIGGKGDDSLHGGTGEDVLLGGKGHDTLLGGEANDILNGGKGNDLLNGDTGDDVIIGGDKTDTLTGGHGRDVFFLEAGGYQDVITDFADGTDLLQLSESLTFDNLIIVNNHSNTGTYLLDGADSDSIVALIENVHAADITNHDFTNA